MYCKNCGNSLKTGSKFCNICGEKTENSFNEEDNSQAPLKAKKISDNTELKAIPIAKKIADIESPVVKEKKFSIIYLWIISIIGLLLGFIWMINDFVSGVIIILSALIIFPPLRKKYVKKFPIRLRYALICSFILFCIGVNISGTNEVKEDNSSIYPKYISQSGQENGNGSEQGESQTNVNDDFTKKHKISIRLSENLLKILKEININSDEVKNLEKIDNWANGERYSFILDGQQIFIYLDYEENIRSIRLMPDGDYLYRVEAN